MGIYLENGYLNTRAILSSPEPFCFVFGGRGTGKTYGCLRDVVDMRLKFLYLRRLQTQVDLVANPEFNPFKKINADQGWNIGVDTLTKGVYGFYHAEDVDGKQVCSGPVLGAAVALSTFSNLRGFDASDYDTMIFDEFIPQASERTIKNEADAFFNAVETVNRNRELSGKPPVKVICLANSNRLDNPLFSALGIIRRAERMEKTGSEKWTDSQRGLALYNLAGSKISEAKKETALYKLTRGSSFAEMALDNKFSGDEREHIASRPLKEYTPIVGVGEITIYKHKSDRSLFVSTHRRGGCEIFTDGETDIARFRRSFGWIWTRHLAGEVWFEDFLARVRFCSLFS